MTIIVKLNAFLILNFKLNKKMQPSPKILITGASGFIGSFLVEEALNRGFSTYAAIRSTSSKAYLKDPRIHLVELNMAHPERLEQQLREQAERNGGAFDYVVHCAGATKCAHPSDFERVNCQQTRTLVDTLIRLGQMPRQFLFVSTLSIFGPIHEKDYRPITEHDTPCPNTAYGQSKLHAEQYLQSLPQLPYVIFRPTGVYGPREKDYFLMAQSIQQHVDFAAGFRRQDLTFVYVKDVVQAVFLAIEKGVTRRAYLLSDGSVYASRTFSDLLRSELGNPFVVRFKSPLWLLKLICSVAGWVATRRGTTSTLNPDKYRIMKQRNWQCDITPAIKELGYRPAYPLARGVKESVAWYKQQQWL